MFDFRAHFAVPVYCRVLTAKLVPLLLAASIMLGVACGDDSDGESAAKLEDPNQTGTELVTKYITLVKDQDVSGLQSFISEAFIIQRANGSHSEKAAYLENLPEIGEFTVTEVSALQADNTLVVRWFLAIEEVIDGQPFSGEPAPRLSTFLYQDGEWRLASHANFNVPEPAISQRN